MSYTYGDYKWVGLSKFHEAMIENSSLATELIEKIDQVRENKRTQALKEQEQLTSAVVETIEEVKPKKVKKS
jgi:hypothetical protein